MQMDDVVLIDVARWLGRRTSDEKNEWLNKLVMHGRPPDVGQKGVRQELQHQGVDF
jgi:hypothetical protein